MRSDDELLNHIRHEAGVRRQRRQRALVGGAAAAVVLLLGAGALAATGGERGESVKADDGGPSTSASTETTTTEVGTTTEPDSTTSTSTTTTAPPDTTPSTTDAPTTTEPPPTTTTVPAGPAPVSETAVGDGISVTATATQDPARPGQVDLTVRIVADHGSAASGSVTWEERAESPEHFGPWAVHAPTSCDELIDDDPTTDTRPDPAAGPVDDTFTFTHHFAGAPRRVEIVVDAYVSFCTADFVPGWVSLPVDVG